MRDLIRPNRAKYSQTFRKRKKRGWFFRFIWKLILFVCIISALPMLALRFIDPPTSSFIELNKRNNNPNIKQQWVCLLYTSPSPRDRTRSRMPSSA